MEDVVALSLAHFTWSRPRFGAGALQIPRDGASAGLHASNPPDLPP